MSIPVLKNGLRLGLKIERPRPITLLMSQYVDLSKLPPTPASFGRYGAVDPNGWGMLGNDSAGCCFWSGAGHASMLWNAEAKRPVSYSEKSVFQAYSEATGFDPSKTDANGDNPTDQGTDMAEGCEFWRTTGIPDDLGARHKIVAYLAIDPADRNQRYAATYLFSASLLGVNLPASAEQQFDEGKPWSFVKGSAALGGHLIVDMGHRDGMEMLSTWGRIQPSYTYALERMAIQGAAVVTAENLINNRSPDGFDKDALLADLKAFGGNAA